MEVLTPGVLAPRLAPEYIRVICAVPSSVRGKFGPSALGIAVLINEGRNSRGVAALTRHGRDLKPGLWIWNRTALTMNT